MFPFERAQGFTIFTRRERVLIVMLAGGSKASQARDITRAQRLLAALDLDL